jgi:hypothetical protein
MSIALRQNWRTALEAPTKRKCQREGCPHHYPKLAQWQEGIGRDLVATRFCSAQCKRKSEKSVEDFSGFEGQKANKAA